MDEMRQRLAKCFTAVFPGLREADAYSANVESLPGWDSTAAIMLASVIEEEFSVAVEYEDLPELVSFDLILSYMKGKSNSTV